jgi:hypothetical protein
LPSITATELVRLLALESGELWVVTILLVKFIAHPSCVKTSDSRQPQLYDEKLPSSGFCILPQAFLRKKSDEYRGVLITFIGRQTQTPDDEDKVFILFSHSRDEIVRAFL